MTRLRLAAAAAAAAAIAVAPVAASPQADEPIRLVAPRALVPLLTQIAHDYAAERGQRVDVTTRSSYDAIVAVRDGTADIAVADSAAEGEAYTDSTAAFVPFAVIVNPAAGVTRIGRATLRGVLDGTVVNWRDAGGADLQIARIERPAMSAAQRVVVRALDLDPHRAPAFTIDDTSSAVVDDVRATPGAVGVIVEPLAGPLDGVRVVAVEGTPILGIEHIVTRASPPFGLQRFVGYIKAASTRWRESRFIPVGR